jgi:hypothetical protein
MPQKDNETLRNRALQLLFQRFEGQQAAIVSEESDTIPSSNENVYRFTAGAVDDPNGPHASIVLSAAGAPLNLTELSRAERKTFFSPDLPTGTIPAEVTDKLVTVDPSFNDFQLTECGFSETIKVEIPAEPVRDMIDVYFLADNTGSMGPAIATVQAGASSVLSTLTGSGLDIQFGVGSYQDFGDPFPFQNLQTITASTSAVTTAIGAWSAGGGGDLPEADLYALQQVVTAAGWRAGAIKFIVWFGDAPGHEPVCAAVWGGGFNITRFTVISALAGVTAPSQPGGIAVLGISVTSGPGLDAASSGGYGGCPSNGLPGQATDITTASGGSLSVGVSPAAITAAILSSIIGAIGIANVSLVPSPSIAPFVTSISPAGGYGPLDPSVPHSLAFDVTFGRGAARCSLNDQVFTGALDVVADGAVVASKPTRITIPRCSYHYTVKFICGVNDVPDDGCAPVRPGRYATEINIYNGHCSEANIKKFVVPVVLRGEPFGREPNLGEVRAEDGIKLPPRTATMDDCCRLAELLGEPVSLSGPLTIGFLEIVSDVPLVVTAVYTAGNKDQTTLSIDVEQIREVRK